MLIKNGKLTVISVCIAAVFIACAAQAQIVFDFEDGNLNAWEVIDESADNLGDLGPSSWQIIDSKLGLDGKVLYQGSNIWGSAADSCLLGTFLIYKGQQFDNFIINIDVAAADNDGMGLVWAFKGTDRHYRAIMINDRWPDVSVDGIEGPFMKIAKRISDAEPWYELLEVVKDDYIPYTEGVRLHWVLEVNNDNFTLTREDGLSISASDSSLVRAF